MYIRLWVLVVLASAVLCAGACYAQKMTVDPNINHKTKSIGEPDVDSRLDRSVTCQAWHVPVKKILEDLSASTGVRLRAGYSDKDWQIRDRRMNISIKDVPLLKLMDSIARVMKFKWSKDSKLTPPVYRLIVDRKLIAAAQVEANRLEKKLKTEEVSRRTRLLEAFAEVADLSGAELQALRKENPYLYMCAQSGFARTVTQMIADEPALRDAFVSADRTANVNIGLFKPGTAQSCVENVRNMWPLDHITQNVKPLEDGFADEIKAGPVYFDCIRNRSEYTQSKRLFYYGSVCVHSADGGHFLGDMRDPYTKSTRAWAEACLGAVQNNEQPATGWRTVAPKYFPIEEQEAKNIEPYMMFDPLVEHSDDPDLQKEVTLKLTEDDRKALMLEIAASGYRNYLRVQYQATLKAIADASSMGIVSDSFSVVLARDTSSFPDKAKLGVLLDKLGDIYRLNWEKHSSLIEMRRRDWFRRRASQLPDEWIDPWRTELEQKGSPSLDTYTDIVALADDQVEENINSDPLLDQVVGGLGGDSQNKEFCRFYTRLSDAQRELLFSANGLNLGLLSPEQSQRYASMFLYGKRDSWRTEDFTAPPEGAIVSIAGEVKPGSDGSSSYTFTARLTRQGSKDREEKWEIPLRKVTPPKTPAGKQR